MPLLVVARWPLARPVACCLCGLEPLVSVNSSRQPCLLAPIYVFNVVEGCQTVGCGLLLLFLSLSLSRPLSFSHSLSFPTLLSSLPSHSLPLPFSILLRPPSPCQRDTCSSIASLLSLSPSYFASLNPGYSCSSSLPAGSIMCVERNSSNINRIGACGQYLDVPSSYSCSQLRARYSTDPSGRTPFPAMDFFRLNPGINCGNLGDSVTSAHGYQVGVRGGAGSCVRSKGVNLAARALGEQPLDLRKLPYL